MKNPRISLKTLSCAISTALCGNAIAQEANLTFEEVWLPLKTVRPTRFVPSNYCAG